MAAGVKLIRRGHTIMQEHLSRSFILYRFGDSGPSMRSDYMYKLPAFKLSENRCALALLYIFVSCSLFSITLGQIALVALLILFLVSATSHWNIVKSDPLVWITAVFIVYVAVRLALALIERPDMAGAQMEGARRLLRSGFVPVLVFSYALARISNPSKHVIGLLAALAIGLLVSALISFDWSLIADTIPARARLGLGMISYAGLALATIGLSAMTVAACCLTWRPFNRTTLRWGAIFLVLSAFAMMGVVLNNTRSVWIGVGVGLLGAIGYLVVCGLKNSRTSILLSVGAVLLLSSGSVYVMSDSIQQRWSAAVSETRDGVSALIEGDIEEIPNGSVGARIHWAVFGARALADRPVIGYGPAESRYLRLERDDVPSNVENRTTHFHNGLLDLALRLGGVGVVLLALGATWVLRAADSWRRIEEQYSTIYVGAFVIAWIVLLGFHQAANHRFLDFEVAYLLASVGGIAHAGFLLARGEEVGRTT